MKKTFKSLFFLEFMFIFTVYLFYYAFIKIKFGHQFNLFYFISDLLILLFVNHLFSLIKNTKIRFVSISLWNTLIYALFITNTFLIVFKNDIFSLSMLSQAAAGFGMLGSYNVFKAFSVIEWILNISVYLASFYVLVQIEKRVERPESYQKHGFRIVANLVLIVLCFLIAPSQDKELIVNPYYNKVKAFERFGLLTYQVTDTNDYLTRIIPLSEEKINMIDKHFETEVVAKKDDYFGVMDNKNVIMIMLEGIDTYMINEDLTPTIYKLMNEGHTFPNMYSVYSNIGTYDAEFKALTSSMYYRGDNYYNFFADNTYPTALANVLRNNGYTANSFHNYVSGFYNRDNMHPSLGFEHFYGVEDMNYDFENDEVPLWPDDETMYKNMIDLIAPVQDKPFFSFVLTVSTHGGYDYHRDIHQEHYEQLKSMPQYSHEDPAFINYAAAVLDADAGIKYLVDDLEKKDLLDDTLLVIFTDHKNYSDMEMTLNRKTLSETNPYLLENVPILIYNPKLNHEVITKPVSHYDITPTVLDLLGIEYIQNYYYGQSMYLKDPINPIIFGYDNWMDENIIVYNDEILWVNPEIKNVEVYFAEKKKFVYYNIEIFQSIIICDYFDMNKPHSDKTKDLAISIRNR